MKCTSSYSRLIGALGISAALLCACKAEDLAPETEKKSALVVSGPSADSEWCEALAVFRTECQSCHGTELAGGAPMPLATYADTQALSVFDDTTPMVERVATRIHDKRSPMPPTSQEPLTQTQLEAIDTWIAAGAPTAEDATCGGEWSPEGEAEFEWPEDCEEFYTFTAGNGSAHVVKANTETHPAFYFDVPWAGTGPVQALAVRPITDNKRVLHHWILNQGRNFLMGWAPGGQGLNSPDGVGIYMPTSGQLMLDTHYYNLGNDNDELDESGFEICITRKLRKDTSAVFPFAASASVPANQRVENQNTCTVVSNAPVYLLSSSPHMHQLGVHAKLEIIRADGSVDVVHDKAFQFEDQLSYDVGPIELFNGDQIRTTCVFENDTDRIAVFGDGSDDEMCFNFASYYPACGMRCSGGTLIEQVLTQGQGGGCPSDL